MCHYHRCRLLNQNQQRQRHLSLHLHRQMKRRHSHMGIYIGDGRFVHAPNSRGRVRVERLDNRYFAQRIDGARTLLAQN